MRHWSDTVVELLTANTADLRELARIAGANPKTFYHGINPDDLELVGQDIEGIEFKNITAERIDKIRVKKTRGERLAMLLDSVLQNRSEAAQILQGYVDHSIYANRAVLEMRRALQSESERGEIDNVSLVRAMRRPLNHQLMDSRANLIYYMSKYLAKYPDIKAYLRKSYLRSTSRDLDQYRPDIEKFLGLNENASRK